jgi:hypothetical protein
MRWFKCPSFSSPAVIEAKRVIGHAGVAECLMVVEEAIQLGVDILDDISVSGWAQIRIDRARRILPFAQKILDASIKDFRFSSDKSEDLRLSSNKFDYLKLSQDNDPPKPHPEAPLKERENKEKELTPTASQCPPLQGGQDSVLKEDKPKAMPPRGTRLNPEWSPKPETIEQMRKERPDLRYERTLASFRDYWTAKAGKDGVKLDWEATFRNWFRNERAAPAHANPMQGGFAGAAAYDRPKAIPPPIRLAPVPEYDPSLEAYYEVKHDYSNS